MKIRLRKAKATICAAEIYQWIACSVKSATYIAITNRQKIIAEIERSNVFIIQCDDPRINKGVYESVGYISFRKRPDRMAYLSELAIHPDFQGHGVGYQALALMIGYLTHQGVAGLYLFTHPENPAKQMYESLGFEFTDRIENYLGSGTPRLRMSRIL